MILLWKLIIVINVVPLFVDCASFENQYLGHSITFDQYNDLELACDTMICLRDAQRLLLPATQNKTIDPCDDFKEFAVGQFIKFRALNERYEYLGFNYELQLLNWERLRKVLARRINDTDIKPFKIAKNYFQKCVNSDYVRESGSAEILEYIKSLGGASFLDSSWNENSFNDEVLFDKEPDKAVIFFLRYKIGRCRNPLNMSQEIVCLRNYYPHKFTEVEILDIAIMFKQLNIEKNLTISIAHEYNEFLSQLNYVSTNGRFLIIDILQLNNKTNNQLNWLKIINSQLTIESQLTNNSQILIEDPLLILNLLQLIKITPKKTIANVFAFYLLYNYNHLFVVYAFDENEFISGTKKSKQRWEQCMLKLFATYGPALQALYAVRYFDNKVHEAAKNFTKEAVKDVIAELKNRDIHDDAIEELVEKLESIHYNIGYTDKVLNLQKIEEFYKDLKLIGDEEIVETFLKIENYDRKISNDPESNWKRKLKSKTSEVEIKYFTDDNILYIPPMYIHYPYYHPNRSRFFNTATLFEETVKALQTGMDNYLYQNWNYRRTCDYKSSSLDLSYINYVKWEESGRKELSLSGFFLTNRQIYWIAIAQKMFFKYHSHLKIDKETNLLFENFHLFFKNNYNFRKAFNCLKLTKPEQKEFNKYLEYP